eukprot:4200897-Pleurochrysis_carterae.AAC.1
MDWVSSRLEFMIMRDVCASAASKERNRSKVKGAIERGADICRHSAAMNTRIVIKSINSYSIIGSLGSNLCVRPRMSCAGITRKRRACSLAFFECGRARTGFCAFCSPSRAWSRVCSFMAAPDVELDTAIG